MILYTKQIKIKIICHSWTPCFKNYHIDEIPTVLTR